MEQPYKRIVDTRMHDYGDIDFDKKQIRVNPRKGDLINTIIHEDLHSKFPDKSEKWIGKKSKKIESTLTVSQAMGLLKKLQRKRNVKNT